jgi:hypothetical protein
MKPKLLGKGKNGDDFLDERGGETVGDGFGDDEKRTPQRINLKGKMKRSRGRRN